MNNIEFTKDNSRYCTKCHAIKLNTDFTTYHGKVFSRCKACVNNYYSKENIVVARKEKYANKKIDELLKKIETKYPDKLEQTKLNIENECSVKDKVIFLKEQIKIFDSILLEEENVKKNNQKLNYLFDFIKNKFPDCVEEANKIIEDETQINYEKKIKDIKNIMYNFIKNL